MHNHTIILAKSAGFCFGVRRAVDLVYALAKEGRKACTLGPIIHNQQVVNDLCSKGVRVIAKPSEAAPDETVVIRSHGVGRDIYEQLQAYRWEDATCPYVSKIHKIVREKSAQGAVVLIAGDAGHPEVQAIRGHCSGQSYVFGSMQELEKILKINNNFEKNPVIMVCQTTFQESLWKDCIKSTRKHYTNIEIFDTICSATNLRQSEAADLAQKVDLMVVIGGRHSSNTRKLKEVCEQYCKTLLIETKDELDASSVTFADKIGITAGASTPAYIIKEVLNHMDEILKNQEEELNFAELLEQSLTEKIYAGKRVKGIITSVAKNEAHVDIGAKQAGIIPASELSDDPTLKVEDIVKPGDELELIVMKVNDQEGIVTLSKKRCDAEAGFNIIREALENDTVLEGVITDVVRGGVLCLSNSTKVFIPASQVSDSRVENLETLLKQKVQFKILEINENRRRAVGSVRAVLKAEKQAAKEQFWQNVEVGKTYTGTVKSITSYGAFVDLGGVDGMIHITELSWTKIKHPSEIVQVGDTVEVYIKDIDNEKKKISLGYKKTEDNPWEILARDYTVGQTVNVTIVSLTQFGAFAQIIPGVDGLIHISQIANQHIAKVADVLEVGQKVDAKITEMDLEHKRISLSIRALLEEEKADAAEEEADDALSKELEGVEGVELSKGE